MLATSFALDPCFGHMRGREKLVNRVNAELVLVTGKSIASASRPESKQGREAGRKHAKRQMKQTQGQEGEYWGISDGLLLFVE
jgi:hypothetical protein